VSCRPLPTKMRRLAALGLALGMLGVVPWQLTAAPLRLPQNWGHETLLPDPATLRFTLTDLGVTDGGEAGAMGINDRGQVAGCAENVRNALFGHAVVWDRGRVRDIGVLPGDAYCRANDINNRGQVVASSYNAFNHNQAFVWQNGSKTELAGLDGYPHSKALSINNGGQVAGYAQTGAYDARRELVARAALWTVGGGRPADLGTLGGDNSAAYGVNDRGQVVGKADTALFGSTHAFLWQNGRMTDLGTLGGPNSLALRVNNRGMVIGYSETGSTTHAFLWQNGALHDLGILPGASSSEAYALNDRGQIVGASDGAAALWQAGKVVDLNRLVPATSGWTLEDATGINASGQIVGRGTAPDGHVHAFLLTPK
jgi:probable HAF family extracellular repeat protein